LTDCPAPNRTVGLTLLVLGSVLLFVCIGACTAGYTWLERNRPRFRRTKPLAPSYAPSYAYAHTSPTLPMTAESTPGSEFESTPLIK
jgi:hypothetical protein